MAPGPVPEKWRPPLALIVLAVLLSVLALPAAIVVLFRALDNTASQLGPVEIGALLVSLLLTMMIALVFARTITGPIDALVRRTQEIGRGGRPAIRPLEHYGTREIAVLSQSFLDLAGRLVDRTEYLQSFAAHVSHELKSPLTAIRGAAELLREAEDGGEPVPAADRKRFLDGMIADADRLAELLDRLRELARADHSPTPGSVRLSDLLADLSARLPQLKIDLLGGDVEVRVPAETLKIVLMHLGDNAARHGATRLDVRVTEDNAIVRVRVSDDGEGISPANRGRIFEPFFTTRRETGGTGMGLSIVRTMLEAHGGSIALVDKEGGAVFELTLPRPAESNLGSFRRPRIAS